MLQLIVLAVAFVLLSGLLAMVDAAVLSVSRAETEELVMKKAWGAVELRRLTQRLTQGLVVIVIATNIVNILGPILVGQATIKLYGPGAIVWITIALTLGTIVFSEILPKSIGCHYAPQISRVAALPILAIIYGLWPLVLLLDWLSRPFKKRGGRRVGTESQIRALATLGRRAGYIEPDEGLLVHRAFILNDRTAADIMTPAHEVVALHEVQTIEQAAEKVCEAEFSRFPVYGESLNDIKGFALSREILTSFARGQQAEPLESITRPAVTVPAEKSCDDLLILFRLRRLHLAVVAEQGKTLGLVTLENVLEELVGEIRDEKDGAV